MKLLSLLNSSSMSSSVVRDLTEKYCKDRTLPYIPVQPLEHSLYLPCLLQPSRTDSRVVESSHDCHGRVDLYCK